MQRRRHTIETTYKNALEKGDKNVYFIDGPALMEICGDEGTVDMTHPTDLGFFGMYRSIAKPIREILAKM